MNPYIGEIRIVSFNFAPPGWLECDGSLLNITDYDTLFSLLGTTYGGDGQYTFALPDFRGRVAIGEGQGDSTSAYILGEMGGQESVALSANQVGLHGHTFAASAGPPTTADPSAGTFAALPSGARRQALYSMTGNAVAQAGMIQPTGGGLPHENRPPTLCMLYLIATDGIYPSQT